MLTTSNYEQTYIVARKVAEYLGLSLQEITNVGRASLYILYSHNSVTYQLRVSDHCANPHRETFIQELMGYIPLSLPNDWDMAKRVIDRVILRIIPPVTAGTFMVHPVYGLGSIILHDIDAGRLDVEFNGKNMSFHANTVLDRGWII